MGYLINSKPMTKAESILKIRPDPEILEFKETFKVCCNAYSHQLFYELCCNKYFAHIFRLFYSSFGVSASIQSTYSLQSRREIPEDYEFVNSDSNHILAENLKKFKPVCSNLDTYLKRIHDLAKSLCDYE
ncbi:unnamed protein product [Moneuplotes crassus]|uniref:Uncharacterized protein n=1 Tax=Euplotes crassus TaxID=5936 RepID=A0AAD1XYL0_EUPCR|nr:unnamed protein product [Moneuplotes crassus]